MARGEVDSPLGRPSLPVSSFRFSPPVPRRPLPVDTTHEYIQPQIPVYRTNHPIFPTERVSAVHPGVVQTGGRILNLAVNTLDNRHVYAGISPILSRPPPPSGLSGLDVLVQAATEEQERIDEHRRLSGGSDRHPTPDEHNLAGHVHSPISAGGSRTHILSPEWRPRPLQPQGHQHGFVGPSTSEQLQTIYNYATQDPRLAKRRRSMPNVSPIMESDANSTLTNAIQRNQQSGVNRTPTSPVNIERKLVSNENTDTTSADLHVASGMEELSLSRSLPNRSQPSLSLDNICLTMSCLRIQDESPAPSSAPGHSHGRRTPPRSKPKAKPGSAALSTIEKQPP